MWWTFHDGTAAAPVTYFIMCVAGLLVDAVSPPIVRRAAEEAHLGSIQLSPHGELVDLEARSLGGPDGGPQAKDFCKREFLPGKVNSDHCFKPDVSNGKEDKLVSNEAECLEAAREAGGNIEPTRFRIGSWWTESHPLGCFQWPCKVKKSGKLEKTICYYYNGGTVEGKNVTGAPVCRRAEYINGTENASGGLLPDSGCTGPYEVIMNEKDCWTMAECLSEKRYYPGKVGFRVGGYGKDYNISQRQLHPQGCFFNTQLGEIQFNPKDNVTGSAGFNNPPKSPVGKPICKIKDHYRVPVEEAIQSDGEGSGSEAEGSGSGGEGSGSGGEVSGAE